MSKDVVLMGACMAALVALSVVTFFCSNRRRASSPTSGWSDDDAAGGDVDDVELGRRRRGAAAGLDEAALAACPTAVYSSSWKDQADAPAAATAVVAAAGERAPDAVDDTRCAVCLTDYADGDELRRIPGCRHAFHRRCIDQWLRRRPTCPVCRTSPPTAPAIYS